ncbi:uncharacterized protein EDB91DRAFT_1348004 [Suillus paluster]|uniref:uncharacterized protein n=1 Tax=Suillus paluster TaxID=48578 RepID=UPI001B873457|nr:uncharacterized protein EDB91DRAFT_1348004 [Suillus paluster]KAG1736630.1 hypothetical protein EDB91DRAFT_1348004 [Suillus paluster]
MSQLIPSITPHRTFKHHTQWICGVVAFPDRRRMVTCSYDKTVCLWDVKSGVVLKKMEGHGREVRALAVSRDGKIIASGDIGGELNVWHGETGESLAQAIKDHSNWIHSLDFAPHGKVLATGSWDGTTKLWNTTTWQIEGNPVQCSGSVYGVQYSPSGELLAIATSSNIEIYKSGTRERVAIFKGHISTNHTLAWTLDGTRLLSGGDEKDPTIREWDASTWTQVGGPWMGHTSYIFTIAIHPAGNHVATASQDIRLWRLSDQQTIAIFQPWPGCVTFSIDGKQIFNGGDNNMISEWETPKGILSVNKTARDACIAGDMSTAEEVFTREIDADANNYTSYANRSFIMARKHAWDHALDDASKSVAIQPSLTGYISQGIALCGKGLVWDARTAFDLAFMFTDEDSTITHFLLLAITIFNADEHQEAIHRVRKLAAACPNNDTLACRVVEAYLCVQLGSNAANHNEAVDYFTAAVNASAFSSTLPIHSIYGDLVVLFGWDLKSLWKNARRKQCDALCRAGRHEEAVKSYQHMMDMSDENTKASCLDWSNAFAQEYSAPYIVNGDAAFAASDYDKAIKLYTVAIDLHFARDTIFANRSKARLEKMLWGDALLDAHQVIQLNPSSHVGYELKHAALHGAQRYDEAIEAFDMMLLKLDSATDTQIRNIRQKYISPSDAENAIRKVIDAQLDTTPLRLLNTTAGLLCDRGAQISTFKKSTEYNDLLLFTMKNPDLHPERIAETVTTYFRCVMLSHRWEGTEPLLHEIKDKVVYELNAAGGLVKLQSFCNLVRSKTEYHWAWVDSCCIDQTNNVELQTSLDSMFAWYRHAKLTLVYLSDVSPSPQPGALARSAWNTRGWTVPEFLAPKVIQFYQQDWTPYMDDSSPNHKESFEIMRELEDATGIEAQTLVAFQPGMRDAREKLRWVSARITTRPEDIAYSLFGIFGVRLPIHYGENKQNALGRLLQEIVAQSGDITALDWVGQPSEFNSCLPADIISYKTPPCNLPSSSEDEIQLSVSSLQGVAVALESALRLYQTLDYLNAPRFAHCRLHLPCIVFPVTEVKRRSGRDQEEYTYGVKADGLHDLQITTKHKLIQFSRTKPTRQTFLLVRPWDRCLLEHSDFAEQPTFPDDAESVGDWSDPESPLDDSLGSSPVEQELVDSESHSRALRLMVRLGQPFGAFLLMRQPGGEYKRIASDHNIIAQVKEVTSVHNMTGVRILEIL